MHFSGDLGPYLSQIGRVPLLTPDEEILLGTAVREWQDWPDGPEEAPPRVKRRGMKARDRMLNANLRLVVHVAKKFSYRLNGGMELMDLIQEGTVGLVRGVEKFDPARGYKFSTFAYWWIRQGIGRALAEKNGIVRVPVHQFELATKMKKTAQQLSQELGRTPSTTEIAEAMGIREERLHQLANAMRARAVVSMDCSAPGSNDDTSDMWELIADEQNGDPLADLDRELAWQQMQVAIDELSERERAVIERTVFHGEIHGVLSEEFGVSRAAITATRRNAISKLRENRTMQRLVA